MGMKQFARHILAVANENTMNVTNLQLQKVMYFSMKETDTDRSLLEDMYDHEFNVWRFGPVVPEVYDRYRLFGASTILDSGERNEKFDIFNEKITELLQVYPFDLVEKSQKDDFWVLNKNELYFGRSDIKYGLDDVLKQPTNTEEVEVDFEDVDIKSNDNGLQM